jgi:predicted Zn-ribbon and HTH transcriptional regulator
MLATPSSNVTLLLTEGIKNVAITHYNIIKTKRLGDFLYKHVEATHRRNEGMLVMKYVMCNKVRCHFTKSKIQVATKRGKEE